MDLQLTTVVTGGGILLGERNYNTTPTQTLNNHIANSTQTISNPTTNSTQTLNKRSKTSTQTIKWSVPTGLNLTREAKTANMCRVVCLYKGYTYLGHGGAIDRIDQHGQVKKAFINLGGGVESIATHNDRLYTIMFCGSNPFKIHVHDLKSTTLITSWTHPTFPNTGQRMCLMGDNQLAVGDWPSKQIVIYSPTGEVIRRVPCPPSLTMTSVVCMSSCGDDSVVISNRDLGKVVRMSLKDGSLLWSSDRISEPSFKVI